LCEWAKCSYLRDNNYNKYAWYKCSKYFLEFFADVSNFKLICLAEDKKCMDRKQEKFPKLMFEVRLRWLMWKNGCGPKQTFLTWSTDWSPVAHQVMEWYSIHCQLESTHTSNKSMIITVNNLQENQNLRHNNMYVMSFS
jgi:hypothetical protein